MAIHTATRSDRNLPINRPRSIAPATSLPDDSAPKRRIGKLWRRKASIVGIATFLMLLGGLTLSQMTPRYTAETLLMMVNSGQSIVTFDTRAFTLPPDNATIASEIEVIKSRGLAEKVIEQLELSSNPEFNVALRPQSKLEELLQLQLFSPGGWLAPVGAYMGRLRANLGGGTKQVRLVDTFLDGLKVTRKGDSRVLGVSYTSQNPETAATIVNVLADVYLREQLATRLDITREAHQRLNERIEQLRRNALESAAAVEKKLQEYVENANANGAELRALEHQAEADREILQTLLTHARAASAQEVSYHFQPQARVISRGDAPLMPSYPEPLRVLGLMLLISILTGVFVVFVDESLDRGIRDFEDTGIPSGTRLLAYLPNTRGRWKAKKPGVNAQVAFAKSVRTLYTGVLLTASGQTPKILLITSTESGEGKTTIAACLALTRAVAGAKTLIVDLNLRKPQLHKMFGIHRTPGLIELLSGDAPLEEVVHTDTASGVDIIPAGAICMNPTDMLMGDNLDVLLKILREKYELIVLDSAPYMTCPDTRVLLDKTDATVFIVRWAQTKRRLVRKTLAEIMNAHDHLTGVALNRVDMKTYAKHGYKTAGYYTGR